MRQSGISKSFYLQATISKWKLLLAVIVTLWGNNVFGQCEITDLWASDGSGDDSYGWSVAISDDSNTLVIGAIGYNDFAGAAYVYVSGNSEWIEHSILTAPDQVGISRFGKDVEISADGLTIVVGEPLADSNGIINSGSA